MEHFGSKVENFKTLFRAEYQFFGKFNMYNHLNIKIMNDFVPSSDAELVTWATNIKDKIATEGTLLGMIPADVNDVITWCDSIINSINIAEQSKTAYESAAADKKLKVASAISKARKFAKDVKRNNSYTLAIGTELGIVGKETTFSPSDYKPTLKAQAFPGYINVKFVKKGVEGINLYGRKKGEGNWLKLGFFAHSPCKDLRPLVDDGQAENREYMCIGVKKDQEIGLQSNIVSIAFAG